MKKLSLLAIVSATAFFAACGDDSSSSPSSKELPKSVKTFFDLADVECTADAKCATIVVEDDGDTYECDGAGQWNMLISSVPSKICPADDSSAPKDEEDDDNTGDKPASGDKPAAGDSGDKPAAGDSGDKPAASKNLVSCMLNSTLTLGEGDDAMELETKGCSEVAEDDPFAASLIASCVDVDESVDGIATKTKATKGSGCEEGYKLKCTGSAGNTVYLYDDDTKDCSGVK